MEGDAALGLLIRNRRKAKGLSVARAAKLAGVSARHWNLVENGSNASYVFLRKVAAAIDLQELPIGGGIRLTTSRASVDATLLLDEIEALIQRADRIRDLALTAIIHPAEPLTETPAVRQFIEHHAAISDEASQRLANATRRLAQDAQIPVPDVHTPSTGVVKTRKRGKA